jgi:hypothetical protein
MARALLHSCTLAAKPTRCQSHQMLLKQMNDEEPLRRRIDQLEQQRKSGICDGPSPPPEHLSLYGERLARVLALPCTPAKPDGSTPMP